MIFKHYQRIWYLGRNRWRLFAHDGSTSKNHSSFDSPNKEELAAESTYVHQVKLHKV